MTKKVFQQLVQHVVNPQLRVVNIGDGWRYVVRDCVVMFYDDHPSGEAKLKFESFRLAHKIERIFDNGVFICGATGGTLLDKDKNEEMRVRINQLLIKYQKWFGEVHYE